MIRSSHTVLAPHRPLPPLDCSISETHKASSGLPSASLKFSHTSARALPYLTSDLSLSHPTSVHSSNSIHSSLLSHTSAHNVSSTHTLSLRTSKLSLSPFSSSVPYISSPSIHHTSSISIHHTSSTSALATSSTPYAKSIPPSPLSPRIITPKSSTTSTPTPKLSGCQGIELKLTLNNTVLLNRFGSKDIGLAHASVPIAEKLYPSEL